MVHFFSSWGSAALDTLAIYKTTLFHCDTVNKPSAYIYNYIQPLLPVLSNQMMTTLSSHAISSRRGSQTAGLFSVKRPRDDIAGKSVYIFVLSECPCLMEAAENIACDSKSNAPQLSAGGLQTHLRLGLNEFHRRSTHQRRNLIQWWFNHLIVPYRT